MFHLYQLLNYYQYIRGLWEQECMWVQICHNLGVHVKAAESLCNNCQKVRILTQAHQKMKMTYKHDIYIYICLTSYNEFEWIYYLTAVGRHVVM